MSVSQLNLKSDEKTYMIDGGERILCIAFSSPRVLCKVVMHLLCVLFIVSTKRSSDYLGQGPKLALCNKATLIFTLNLSNTWLLPLILSSSAKGHFSIFMPVETDLAPVTRLLLFIILPDGEIVADTVKYEIGNCLDNKVCALYNKISTFITSSPVISRSFYMCVD